MTTYLGRLQARTHTCRSCGYAYTGKACKNPACRVEQADRDRIAMIRRRHGGY